MAQVKECLEKSYECSRIINAVPKSCLEQTDKHIDCRYKKYKACKTLKNGYKYVQPCRPAPCKPVMQTHVSDEPFADDSVYTCSFYPYDPCESRQPPVVHKDHITITGEFQDETVHKMSYPVQCVPVVRKIVPRDHCLGGTGSMRLTTTQQHDYYTPGGEREKNVSPPRDHLALSGGPMAKLTTASCSYRPVCASPAENFKPAVSYAAPVDEMDLNTVQRSSYKDAGPVKKTETPWVVRLEYCKPKNAVECCTVYNYSYKEPGAYVMQDDCGNSLDVVAGGKSAENCCPFACLADYAEQQSKSTHIKAHQFDD